MPSDISHEIWDYRNIIYLFYSLGLIFIALATIPIGYEIILLTRFIISNLQKSRVI